MNHKEFRPGNLVNVSGEPKEITGVLQFGMYFHLLYYPFNLSQIEPIELTKEWLVKFGFKFAHRANLWFIGENPITKDWMVTLRFDSEYNCFYYQNGHFKIKTVNQLQNFYFALTGNELTIKSNENNQ